MGNLGWFMSKTQTATSPPREGEPAGTRRKGEKKRWDEDGSGGWALVTSQGHRDQTGVRQVLSPVPAHRVPAPEI